MSETAKVMPLRKGRPCPECGKPSARETYPFCSARCKEVDLNRWLTGSYVIPGRDGEAADVEGAPQGGPPPRDSED